MFAVSYKLYFGIAILLVAIIYTKWTQDRTLPAQVIAAWQSRIKLPLKPFSRVTVGINANIDLIVEGTTLLSSLGVTPANAADHAQLDSLGHLQEAFMWSFTRGGAAERPFSDAQLFATVVDTASNLNKAQWFIGGNAALIAQKIVTTFPDTAVQLVGPVGPRLKGQMSRHISVPRSSLIDRDEVHLIMELKRGAQWGSTLAPVSTRFITSNDPSNGEARPLESFFASMPEFEPDLVVLSGLHMLDGQAGKLQDDRLTVLTAGLDKLPWTLPVHLELASMADAELMKSLAMKVFPRITSLGLNEQELAFVSRVLGSPHGDRLFRDDGQPELPLVTDTLTWLLQTAGYSESNRRSRLTRIHFHSLSFHLVATSAGVWFNSVEAVSAGAYAAGRQACDHKFEPDQLEMRISPKLKFYSGATTKQFDSDAPVSEFTHNGFSFAFSPVLVCLHPEKTVGLGDAISATGLLYSEFRGDNTGYAQAVDSGK